MATTTEARETRRQHSPLDGLDGFADRFIPTSAGTLHAVVDESGAGEPIVLLAGFPETWYAWREVMPSLAADHPVIAIDLPGQGESEPSTRDYDTGGVAAALREAIESVDARPHWLFAHDVGSWVAFSYALLFPQSVRGVALLDAGIPGITLPESIPLEPSRAHTLWHFAFHLVAELPETLLAGKEREYVEWFLRAKSGAPELVEHAVVDRYADSLKREGSMAAALGYYRAAHESAAQNRRLLDEGRLTVPVLAVDSDAGSIPDMAAPLRPHAVAVCRARIPGAGHFIPEERPRELTRELLAFIHSPVDAEEDVVPAPGSSRRTL